MWHFAGHGTDCGFSSNPSVTLGLMDASGRSALVPRGTIVSLAASASQNNGGKLRLIVLNACSSGDLGRQLITDARIPHVVCWDSEADDGAALAFAKGFWIAIAGGDHIENAFQAGKLAIETIINKTTGTALYKMDIDPAFFPTGTLPDGRVPAGIPLLLTCPVPQIAPIPPPPPPSQPRPQLMHQQHKHHQHNEQQQRQQQQQQQQQQMQMQQQQNNEDEELREVIARSLIDRQQPHPHSHRSGETWTCTVCTFINAGNRSETETLCAMCETPMPMLK